MLPAGLAAAGSAVAMLLLYQPGMDPTRVYEGTDTRAFGLLIGAMLALAWPSGKQARRAQRARRASWRGSRSTSSGLAGLAGIGVMIWRVGEYSPFAYRGGLVLLSVATVAVVAATAYPAKHRRRGARLAPAALDRGPLLRHLPLALSRHRDDDAGQHEAEPADGGAADRGVDPARRAVLAADRGADQARRDRAGLGQGPRWPAGGARCVRSTCQAWRPPPARSPSSWSAAAGLSGAVRTGAGSRVGSVLSEGSLQLPVTKTVVKAPKRQAGAGREPVASRRRCRRHAHRAAAHVLPRGRAHRRLHLGRPGLARLPAQAAGADHRAVRGRRRPLGGDRHLRRALGRRGPARPDQRLRRDAEHHPRRIPRLLGHRAGDKRHSRRGRRVERRPGDRIGRVMKAAHGEPVHVGQREVAAGQRPLRRGQHGALGSDAAQGSARSTRTCGSTTGPPR